MASLLWAGLDVGGTTMKAGIIDDAGGVLGHAALPTEPHRGQDFGLARMAETIRAATEASHIRLEQIAAIGVATPGLMDIPAGIITDPPNLKPWRNVPVRQYIQDAFKLPTAFQNDANAAAYGEYCFGAGKDVHSMVLFTLGTGVGGGIIVGDRILQGEHSHGAELGHLKIEMTNPRQCGCGRWGCLEAYASATAVVKRALDALDHYAGPTTLRDLVAKVGADNLTSEEVFKAAETGDALADCLGEETDIHE